MIVEKDSHVVKLLGHILFLQSLSIIVPIYRVYRYVVVLHMCQDKNLVLRPCMQ